MAASPHAADILVGASAEGDYASVRALVARGVPIDAKRKGDWRNALHVAAAQGNMQTIRFLVDLGANKDALDRSGDSPSAIALLQGHSEAFELFTSLGAKRIHGTLQQHDQATRNQLEEEAIRRKGH
jgi:ankyrin repeat protein